MQTPSGSDADCAVWLLINERPWDSDLRPETTELRRTSPSLRRSRYATEWPMSARFAANATISARRSNAANSASAIPWKRRCSSLTLPGCFPEAEAQLKPRYSFFSGSRSTLLPGTHSAMKMASYSGSQIILRESMRHCSQTRSTSCSVMSAQKRSLRAQ